MVRIKCSVGSVRQERDLIGGEPAYTISLLPVFAPDSGNESVFASTPTMRFEMSGVNEETAKYLEAGMEVHVDVTRNKESLQASLPKKEA